jgi:hypothetical protein
MLSVDEYLWFVDQALDAMIRIIVELGDELANQQLDLPGANSPYAILTHCLGVMEYWAGSLIAGRTIERDRAAEFRAAGPVEELVNRTRRARQQLQEDLTSFVPLAAPVKIPLAAHLREWPEDADLPLVKTQGAALIHVLEELSQHRGQMETCRDVLLAGWAQSA